MSDVPSPGPAVRVPVLLLCGVSGSGKSTIGALLAERLDWVYAEADAFHPSANIAKMAAPRGRTATRCAPGGRSCGWPSWRRIRP
jgi:gluconokinase